MSERFGGILYTRIGTSCTAKVGDGSLNSPNAVSSDFEGEVAILPKVRINGVSCRVIEISKYALRKCSKVTNVIIPNTITTLRERCIGYLSLVTKIIIPSSVILVESYFINRMNPQSIIFCGAKEPTMSPVNEDVYFADIFRGNIIVRDNYDSTKNTFCKKKIERKKERYFLSPCFSEHEK